MLTLTFIYIYVIYCSFESYYTDGSKESVVTATCLQPSTEIMLPSHFTINAGYLRNPITSHCIAHIMR